MLQSHDYSGWELSSSPSLLSIWMWLPILSLALALLPSVGGKFHKAGGDLPHHSKQRGRGCSAYYTFLLPLLSLILSPSLFAPPSLTTFNFIHSLIPPLSFPPPQHPLHLTSPSLSVNNDFAYIFLFYILETLSEISVSALVSTRFNSKFILFKFHQRGTNKGNISSPTIPNMHSAAVCFYWIPFCMPVNLYHQQMNIYKLKTL